MRSKVSSGKRQPSCLGLIVLMSTLAFHVISTASHLMQGDALLERLSIPGPDWHYKGAPFAHHARITVGTVKCTRSYKVKLGKQQQQSRLASRSQGHIFHQCLREQKLGGMG